MYLISSNIKSSMAAHGGRETVGRRTHFFILLMLTGEKNT